MKLRVRVFPIPTSAVRPTVFPTLDRVAHKTLQPSQHIIAQSLEFVLGE